MSERIYIDRTTTWHAIGKSVAECKSMEQVLRAERKESKTMTQRMKKFGITEEAFKQGVKENEFLNNADAFFAKLLTLKSGTQIRGIDLMRKWFPEYSDCEYFLKLKLKQAQPFLFGLSEIHSECLNYTDTCGLDCLSMK